MRAAPLVAGYPVVDLCACARQPTVQLDPLSAAIAGHLESAVGAAAERSALSVRWVAAVGGRYLFVEAAGRAPADAEGPELLVLAHLVEPADARPRRRGRRGRRRLLARGRRGRRAGRRAGIGRAALPRDLGSGSGTGWRPAGAGRFGSRPPARLGLAALRERLVGPARVAEGLETPGEAPANEAVVLPFRR